MAWSGLPLLVAISVVVFGLVTSRSTVNQCNTTFRGCSIDKGLCVCSETVDCVNPYPYKDIHQCKKDIKGELDKCRREPCLHGQCVQAKHDEARRWECSCAGSGFYGKKCEKTCPEYENIEKLPSDYPSDCIY